MAKKIIKFFAFFIWGVVASALSGAVSFVVIDNIFPPAEECENMADCFCWFVLSVGISLFLIVYGWEYIGKKIDNFKKS